MDKENYLTELEEYLDALTADEKADVIEFYNEYIDDAGLETTDEIEKRLGTPRQLSRKVLADYSIKATDIESHRSKKSKASVRSNGKMIWMILLALLASPAAIVLGLVLFAILACVVAAGSFVRILRFDDCFVLCRHRDAVQQFHDGSFLSRVRSDGTWRRFDRLSAFVLDLPRHHSGNRKFCKVLI